MTSELEARRVLEFGDVICWPSLEFGGVTCCSRLEPMNSEDLWGVGVQVFPGAGLSRRIVRPKGGLGICAHEGGNRLDGPPGPPSRAKVAPATHHLVGVKANHLSPPPLELHPIHPSLAWFRACGCMCAAKHPYISRLVSCMLFLGVGGPHRPASLGADFSGVNAIKRFVLCACMEDACVCW